MERAAHIATPSSEASASGCGATAATLCGRSMRRAEVCPQWRLQQTSAVVNSGLCGSSSIDSGRAQSLMLLEAQQRPVGRIRRSVLCNGIPRRSRSDNGAGNAGPLVVVDNYDSFTYNLCQYLGELGCEYVVLMNDERTVEELKEMKPRAILLSPGPGRPEDSGISMQVAEELGPDIPLLGVCMGHQCIGQAFGGKIIQAPCGVMHGKTSMVLHNGAGVLEGLPSPLKAARYHSLVIDSKQLPEVLEITAWTEDGTIMGVRHKDHPHVQGLQFHPESIITDNGRKIVENFINGLKN